MEQEQKVHHEQGPHREQRPNMVIIMADDMGFSDIGCYGSEIRTPHLDALAEQGVRMTHMYNCARCCPSRASLLTGLYPHQAGMGHMIRDYGVPSYQGYLRNDCVTIAEVLKEEGYATGMSGKWHVGGKYDTHPGSWRHAGEPGYPLPTQRGFDRFFGTLCGAGNYFDPHTLMEQDTFVSLPADEPFYYTDAISEHAASMIEQFHDQEQPFFLYVAYTAPHWPLHAHPDDIRKYEGTYRDGWDHLRQTRYDKLIDLGLISPDWPLTPRDEQASNWNEADHPEWEDARMAVYAAQIDRMDQGIGHIRHTLRKLQLEQNTLILFLSDNGGCAELLREDGGTEQKMAPMRDGTVAHAGNTPAKRPGGAETYMSYGLSWANASNTPFRLYKSWVHEGGISTPLIAYWPDGMGVHERIVHHPAHVKDIMATCLEAANASYPIQYQGNPVTPCEGESLLPSFRENTSIAKRSPLFWEHEGNRAMRDEDWKLVSRHGDAWELYHMGQDRTEMNNVANEHPQTVQTMIRQYEQWAERCGVLDWREVTAAIKRK